MKVQLIHPAHYPAEIERVIEDSFIGNQHAPVWLNDPDVEPIRKACLLNVLAALSVNPVTAPMIRDVSDVFGVLVDRIHVVLKGAGVTRLRSLCADTRQTFYQDPTEPLPIHRAMLESLPYIASNFDPAAPLLSFRGQGAPSLQMVVSDSPSQWTVADCDLDEYNPDQDVASFAGHMVELVRGRKHGPTDHFAMRERLASGPAAPFLCYTLVQS